MGINGGVGGKVKKLEGKVKKLEGRVKKLEKGINGGARGRSPRRARARKRRATRR